MWSQITDQIITGLVFFQLIMTALLGVRKSPAAILVRTCLPGRSATLQGYLLSLPCTRMQTPNHAAAACSLNQSWL